MGIAILVRHGESETNVRNLISSDYDGYPLTETGRRQAVTASEQFRGMNLNSFLTSPVQRARETAKIISGSIGMDPVIDERIKESGMGKYNNRNFTDIPKLRRSELGMETWESHQNRFLGALEDINGVALLVSHAFPIRATLSYYLGLNEEESYGINIRNASISVIDLEKAEVLCIGSRHLTERVKGQIARGII